MATTTYFTESFESYSNGSNLNGQGGWSDGLIGSGAPYVATITNAQHSAGSKSVMFDAENYYFQKSFGSTVPANDKITITFDVRCNQGIAYPIPSIRLGVAGSGDFSFSDHFYGQFHFGISYAGGGAILFIQSGNNDAINPFASSTISFLADTWYSLVVEIDTSSKQARIKQAGGTWSDYVDNEFFVNTDRALAVITANEAGSGKTNYLDNISVTSESAPVSPSNPSLAFRTGF